MMKFVVFKLSDEDAINKFLAVESENIAKDGVHYDDGKISFLYSADTEEERHMRLLAGGVREGLLTFLTEASGIEVDIRYHRGQAARGVKKSVQEVVNRTNDLDSKLAQIKYTRDVLYEIETGQWPPVIKEGTDPAQTDEAQ